MLQIKIDAETERRLADVAARTGDAPDALARHALDAYLEDLEDYAIAIEAWREHDPAQTLSTEEMLRALGVDD